MDGVRGRWGVDCSISEVGRRMEGVRGWWGFECNISEGDADADGGMVWGGVIRKRSVRFKYTPFFDIFSFP